MLAITVVVWRRRDRAPYAFTGWLWFAGTLVPVIGLVQVGSQSMADRYTYVPHIGLYVMLVWATAEACARWRVGTAAITAAAVAAFGVLAALTWVQVGYWRNGTTLFGHTIAVTERNFIATNNYGVEMLEAGRLEQARQSFETATRYNPRYETGLYNLGVAYRKQERYEEAAEKFRQALAISPDDARAQLSLAIMLAVRQNYVEAIPHYERALALAPTEPEVRLSFSNALNNYGVQLSQQGRQDDAIRNFRRALEVKPDNPDAKKNLDFALQSGPHSPS
jgi:tetratricopeptide (TPR) repeat protein